MGLVLKHIERTKSGSFQYRRRVPKAVAGIIPKREFKQKLGDTEKEALRAWPVYHAQVEREIEEARRRAASSEGTQTEREAYDRALRVVREVVPDGAPDDLRDVVADQIAGRYRLNPETWTPIDASPPSLAP